MKGAAVPGFERSVSLMERNYPIAGELSSPLIQKTIMDCRAHLLHFISDKVRYVIDGRIAVSARPVPRREPIDIEFMRLVLAVSLLLFRSGGAFRLRRAHHRFSIVWRKILLHGFGST
ncbi:hypothetical protein C1T17_06285 [Sphingobium sp. SCG-1]|nr:hypothetical protein C1T17_06285 [Sphingobium sp. SCG-1]